MQNPILVLCIDRDNDLFEKAKISGPVVGRKSNITAATKLALADPEDPDANAIFSAVKTYDELKKDGKNVEVVTISGHKSLGYTADMEISQQLDRIISELQPASAIFISDGLADEEIMPIIKSRLKIDATKVIFIKQAKELEKTYFVLIEKLRDPHYARFLIGVPALLLILLAVSSYLGWGWQVVAGIVGVYLLLKISGIEEWVLRLLKDFRFSTEKTTWIGYICGFALLIIAMLMAYQSFIDAANRGLRGEKIIGFVLSNTIVVVWMAILTIIASKIADAVVEKRKFLVAKYSLYAIAATLLSLVLKIGSSWVVNIQPPYVDFGDFLFTLITVILAWYIGTKIVKDIRIDILLKLKLEGKEVINEHGTYIGKIVGINNKEEMLVIQTLFDKRYGMPFSAVSAVGENVIVRASIG